MQELTKTANLVDWGRLESARPITAVLERSDLEAAVQAGAAGQLWFELGREGDEETTRLTVDVASADLEEILRLSTGDDVTLALDGAAVAGLFEDAEVEAHGMRGALAIAVAAAAVVAPTSLAASPQTASAAATAQRAGAAASVQLANPAATAQVSSLAKRAQVSKSAAKPQVSSLASKAQVSPAAKAQISKSLVVKASGIQLLRGGLAR